jgi:hypothetical protein
MQITIIVEADSPERHHKCTITPSVAVNPPATQYFKGISSEDNRLEQMTSFVITMLSSKEYPNPPICSERTAKKIALEILPVLLKNLKYCKKSTRSFSYDKRRSCVSCVQ